MPPSPESSPTPRDTSGPRLRVVFLDGATLPGGITFTDPARIDYQSWPTTAQDDVADRIRDADVVITNKIRIGDSDMAGASRLKLIAVAAAGTDNVDLDAAKARGIAVRNVPDYGSDSVAEHVIASLFALRRHLLTYAQAARDGRWSDSTHFCWHGPRIADLNGSTIGIVGRGRIGDAVARLATGLGMNVITAQLPGRPARPDGLPLDDVLARADAVSLHVPLTPQTRHLIDARALARMKPDAVLLNAGRGALVDAQALIDALKGGRLAGAALDVLDVEPPPRTHPLLAADLPNLLVTPHVAWASSDAQARLARRLAEYVDEVGRPRRQ